MRMMTGMGRPAVEILGESAGFNGGLHSTGDLSPDRRYICHFPEDNTIWSIGSGYGGNALLGKKWVPLRRGSFPGKEEGLLWQAMFSILVRGPGGKADQVARPLSTFRCD